jgi:hypothetical protein
LRDARRAKECFVTMHQKIHDAEPQIKTVRAEGEWKGNYRTDLDVRDFRRRQSSTWPKLSCT